MSKYFIVFVYFNNCFKKIKNRYLKKIPFVI